MDPIQSLSNDPISRLGPLPLLRVDPTQSLRDALEVMQSAKSGCVLVAEGNRPVGIMTERDVLRHMGAVGSLDVPASQIASKKVWTIRPTDSVETALRSMNEHQCRHLTVVTETGEAIGVLSVKLIVRTLVEHFPSSVYNLPPVANQVQRDREGA